MWPRRREPKPRQEKDKMDKEMTALARRVTELEHGHKWLEQIIECGLRGHEWFCVGVGDYGIERGQKAAWRCARCHAQVTRNIADLTEDQRANVAAAGFTVPPITKQP